MEKHDEVYFVVIYYAHGVSFTFYMNQERANEVKAFKKDRSLQILQYGDQHQAVIDHEYTCHIDISPVNFPIKNDFKLENLKKYGVTS